MKILCGLLIIPMLLTTSPVWAATFTMGYPPPGGVSLSGSGPGSGTSTGKTFSFTGFNSSAYAQLYWGVNVVSNVIEQGAGSPGNMVFQSYNSTTGIATWVSTANWVFSSGFNPGGCCSIGTQLLVQLQPDTNSNPGFLSSGFLSPTTTKGALGIAGDPSEPLYLVTGPYQVTFEFYAWDGSPADAGNPAIATPILDFNNAENGGPGVNSSADFEFWSSARTSAHTVQVGGCKTNLPNFSTIQAAVSSVPSGAVVEVCPGNYPEQVKITSPLTLDGITNGLAGQAVVSVPPSGLAQNGTGAFSGFNHAAQILIQDAGPVTITNLTIDGTSSICPPPGGVEGIAFLSNSGSAFGKVINSVVQNIGTNTVCGAESGNAIYAENGSTNKLTVQGNSIQNFSGSGVYFWTNQNGTIASNSVAGGPDGIGVVQGNTTTAISGNTMSGLTGTGVSVQNSNTATVSTNTISMTAGTGVSMNASGSGVKITGNKVAGGSFGISLVSGNGAIVQTNTVSSTGTALVLNESGGGGSNSVTGNTVNGASCGISKGNAAGSDNFIPNSLLNVALTTCP